MRAAILSAALLAAAPAAAEYGKGDCLDKAGLSDFAQKFGETNLVLLHAREDDPARQENPNYFGLILLSRPDGGTWSLIMNFANERFCLLDYGIDAEFPDVIVRGKGVKS